MIYAVRDGASYRSIYTPLWRPGQPVTPGFYGYWSAYLHNPDGTVVSTYVNLSQCDNFAQVERKVRKWHPGLPVRDAHKSGDSYVD